VIPEGSLAHLLQWRLDERPDLPFLWVEDDGPWTFADLGAVASDLEVRLAQAGVGSHDRVLVRLGNDERFLPALIAVWLRGGLAVAMHPSTPPLAARDISAEMQTSLVVCAPGDPLADEPGTGGESLALTVNPVERGAARSGGLTQTTILAVPSVATDDPAVVLLTSGSTGRPKGVTLSHRNIWASLRSTVLSFSRDGGPKRLADPPPPPNLVANPLSHTGGLIRLLIGLYAGRPLVLLRKFDPTVARRMVERHAINNLTINPSMMKMLLDGLAEGEDLGSVRYVSSGTAPLAPALREAFETRFSVPVLQSYGQTEVGGAISIESVRDVLSGLRRPNSVGKPLPGMEVRILGLDGEEQPNGEDGEITVRSSANSIGYLGSEDHQGTMGGGRLRTGDIGHFDQDGYLYVTGRIRSLIICGGFNVIPEEIEAAIIDGVEVLDAAVVGLPDPRLGEIPVAIVEPAADVAAVLARANERLVPYKRPRLVFSVESLPRLPIGKVDRAAVRRLAHALVSESDPDRPSA
jgi:long-chain acyl-CoA synthetase